MDGSWLGIEGIEQLTVGQLAILILVLTTTLTYIANFVRIVYSKTHPEPTQSEKVDLLRVFVQILAYIAFTVAWFTFSFQG